MRNPSPPGNLGSKMHPQSPQCSDDRKYGNVKRRVVLKQRVVAPDNFVIARLSRGVRLDPGVRGKSTRCILDLVGPNIPNFTGNNSEPWIKSETLHRAGSTTEQVNNNTGHEQHKRTLPISTEKNQKFGKWQHVRYVFIQSYFKTQILQSIITHLPFNTPVIPFCPA